jgi:ADP-ribosylglycohydrolase
VRSEPLERARTSLQGLAVGDAFGETLFGAPDQVARRIAQRLISTKRPWRWTDDTAMALSVVEILGHHSTIDPDALAAAFARRWAADPDRGYGHGTSQELGMGLDVAAHDTVAFYLWVAARHLASYEDAIWTATSQDGDRDTLGAIVGSIVVLATGVDGIPILWRAATEPIPSLLEP